MAHYSLCFLDNLNAIEAKELKEKDTQNHKVPTLISNILNLPKILGLDNFNPNPAFQESLDFISKTP